jgi:hypothetical protein
MSGGVKHKLIPAVLAISITISLAPAAAPTSRTPGVEIVEIGKLQATKTLGGIVLVPDNSPLQGVEVIEAKSDWQTTLRTAKTDGNGRWSFPAKSDDQIHYLRFITNECCFNEVRRRVKLNKLKRKHLSIKLPLST